MSIEHAVPTCAHREPLSFEHLLVLAEEQTDVEILSLGHALHLIGRHVAVAVRVPHENRILVRDEELRAARIALTAGAAAQLVIDAPAVVTIRADDVQPAELGDASPEPDVHAAARHVRRDRHGAPLAGARDDRRLGLLVAAH